MFFLCCRRGLCSIKKNVKLVHLRVSTFVLSIIIHGAQELRNINFVLHKDEFNSFLRRCFIFLYFFMFDFSLLVLKICWFFLLVIMKIFWLLVWFFVSTKKVGQKIWSSIWSLCCGAPSSNSKSLHYKSLWDIKWWLSTFDDVPWLNPFFVMPKAKNFKNIKHSWFMKTLMDRNIFGWLNKKLTNDIPTLKGKWFIDKTRWGNVILRMVEALVLIWNHCDAKSHVK